MYEIFPLRNYLTPNGQPKSYHHAIELMEVMGGAKSIRYQVQINSVSNANARATVEIYEGALTDVLPIDQGGSPLSTTTISATGPTFIQLNAPFSGRIQVVLKISDQATANPMTIEMRINATLILEE